MLPDLRCLGLLALCAVPVAAATWYVSPQGDDAHPGTGPAPAQALRTIQAGVNRLQPGDTLLVRGGVYRETVTFPRGGEPGRPLTVQRYQDEPVTITGCDPVTGWTLHDAQQGIWKASQPWTLGLGRNQVFVNGEVQLEARYPNEPEPGLGMYVADLSPLWPTFAALSIPDPQAAPGRITGRALEGFAPDWWRGACYYGVHYEGWAAQTGVIESSRDGEITVGDRTRGWWFGPAYGGNYRPEEGRGMIVGHLHALDRPGEWHWQDNTLLLIPPTPGEPRAVEAKRRHLAFDLSGREHVHLRGLTIHAASLRLQDSAWCTVDDCHVSYVSHYTRHYNVGQVELGRDTLQSGETGIFVGGHDNQFTNCSVRYSAGAGFYLRGYHHTIHNCLIDEVSYTSHYLNAITDAVSDFNNYEHFLVGGHVITHNTMRNAGRHFFNFYGNGTSTASRDRGPMDYLATLFAHNHLYNGMLQTKDAGLITGYYSSGGTLCGLNSQVAYNVIHDSYDTFGMRINALGLVYLDAGSCDVDLHHNLLWAAPGSLQRGLWFNTMCVDVHEHDNRFHPEFTRTPATLTAADFPGGQPFRFGHDFADRPPLPAWPPLDTLPLEARTADLAAGAVLPLGEVDLDAGWSAAVLRFASEVTALNADRARRARPRHRQPTDPLVLEGTVNDGQHPAIGHQWTFLHSVPDGGWVRYNQVPLGPGYRRFRVIYGNDQPANRWLEVHLDAVDGPLVGRVDLPPTDRRRGPRIQVYQAATGTIDATATGQRDVFLVFRSADGQRVGEFEYCRFEQARQDLPLAPQEALLELRAGSPAGDRLGVFYLRATGGPATVRELVTTLEPGRGRQPLFLVARSAVPGRLGLVDGLRLERAAATTTPQGLGAPPLTRDGRLVLPQATHRPVARPAEQYGHVAAPAERVLGLAVAARVTTPPRLDGLLADWPGDEDALVLAERPTGIPTNAPPSLVWVAYDDQALYVAARHPVSNPAAIARERPTWGVDDGHELALQAPGGPLLNVYGYPNGTWAVATASPRSTAAGSARLPGAVGYRAALGAGAWTAEWRIPFDACGFTPATAPLVGFNVGVRRTAPAEWVVWRGTGGAIHEVEQAGQLAFATEFAGAGPVRDGLTVWLDAADPASLVIGEAGGVALWRDKSGTGHDARQTVADHQPRVVADGLNGRPALRFDEARRTRLELPDLSDQPLTATIYAVVSNRVAGSEVNHDPRIFAASDGQGYDYQVGLHLSVRGLETGGPRILRNQQTGRGQVVRVGCFSPQPQTFFTGEIAEVLVYRRVVPPADDLRLRVYLAAKWGLR